MKLLYVFISLLLLVGVASAASPVGTWVLPNTNAEVHVYQDGTGVAMLKTWFLPMTDSFTWMRISDNLYYVKDYWGREVYAKIRGDKIVSDAYPAYELVRQN